MKINCDIGERGISNKIDQQLMTLVDIANIACGGHAGDQNSIDFFRRLALENDVQVSAHLSYPDRENFGRVSMSLETEVLFQALDQQYSLINDVKWIKFHGALYNDLNVNKSLAKTIYAWLKKNKIEVLLCPQNSEIAKLCNAQASIQVMPELFAERAYIYDKENQQFALMPRTRKGAVLEKIEDALAHCRQLMQGNVWTYEDDGTQTCREIYGESICIHSDAKIALELVQELRGQLD
jgi:UPF0271 protein